MKGNPKTKKTPVVKISVIEATTKKKNVKALNDAMNCRKK